MRHDICLGPAWNLSFTGCGPKLPLEFEVRCSLCFCFPELVNGARTLTFPPSASQAAVPAIAWHFDTFCVSSLWAYAPISASWIFTLPFWLSGLQSNYGESSATSQIWQPRSQARPFFTFLPAVLHLFTVEVDSIGWMIDFAMVFHPAAFFWLKLSQGVGGPGRRGVLRRRATLTDPKQVKRMVTKCRGSCPSIVCHEHHEHSP